LVALSLNFDPKFVDDPRFITPALAYFSRERLVAAKRKFVRLITIADGKVARLPPLASTQARIGEFAKWAKSVEWEIPPELEARATEGEDAELDEKPLEDSERKTLLKLVLGMAMMGYAYDPTKQGQKAIAEICEDLESLRV
jgi:hypothetical protein